MHIYKSSMSDVLKTNYNQEKINYTIKQTKQKKLKKQEIPTSIPINDFGDQN